MFKMGFGGWMNNFNIICKHCSGSNITLDGNTNRVIEEFEEQLIDNLGWNKPEHYLLRGKLGIKFSTLLRKRIKDIEGVVKDAIS